MQIQLGALTLRSLTRFTGAAQNAGVVTLTSPAVTVIATVDLGQVALGDVIFAESVAVVAAGAGSLEVQLQMIKNAGTATVIVYNTGLQIVDAFRGTAGANSIRALSGFFVVTAAGTLTIEFSGTSPGGDSTIAAGNGQFRVMNLAGQVAVGA